MEDINLGKCDGNNTSMCETIFKQIIKSLDKLEVKLEGLPDLSASIRGIGDQMDRILSDRMPERLAALEVKIANLEESRKESVGGSRVWIPVAISVLLSLGSLIHQLVK